MSGKFRLAVLLTAAAAWLVAESQADAGCHRRRARSGGCHTTSAGCNTGCAPVAADCCTAAPAMDDSYEAAPAPPAPASPSDAPAPPAPAPDAGASTPAEAPQVVAASPSEGVYNSANRRVRRGLFRR